MFCACKVSLEKSYMFYKRHVPCCLQGERRIDMMQDEQIVELYFKRDERALVETSDKYGIYCRSIARKILNDEETAKECFNDTLYHSWQNIPPKRPNCLRIFLGKVIRFLSLKHWEQDHAQKRGGNEATLAIDELEECVVDRSAYSADEQTEDMVIREVMDRFLEDLTVQNRRIFMRRYWYCSSVKEISAALGVSESNVMTSLSRVRGKLREALEKAGIVL